LDLFLEEGGGGVASKEACKVGMVMGQVGKDGRVMKIIFFI
jgi:hypothetical protein